MKKRIIKKIQKQAQDKTEKWKVIEITKVDKDKLPLMNRRCMFNSMHEYKSLRSVAIIEVLSEDSIAHYLSMDESGDIYDTTLGYSWSGVKYKLSRYIHPESTEASDMNKVLCDFKERLFNMSDKRTLMIAKLLSITADDCF